ncbi:hypothetical protein [Flavobacterium inviolabile]|nr:hypothetical protein [Flavobacterium inviolabile]
MAFLVDSLIELSFPMLICIWPQGWIVFPVFRKLWQPVEESGCGWGIGY